MKEYDTFILNDQELPDGTECQITIRDLTPGKHKYDIFQVKALVSSDAQLPESDLLWIRTELGYIVNEKPWRIRIIERLEAV